MAKYYVMTKDPAGKLQFYMDGILCFAAEDWVEAKEGIVTEPEIVEEPGYSCNRKQAVVRGKMVEAENVALDELDYGYMDLLDLVAFTDFMIYAYEYGKYYAKLKNIGFTEVEFMGEQRLHHDEERQKEVAKEIVSRITKQYGFENEQQIMEVLIRNFAKKTLDCASYVEVYDRAMFDVTYPGFYRDFCSLFIIRDGEPYNTNAVRFAGEFLDKKRPSSTSYRITLEKIAEEMDVHGISAGEDSGDEVPGVSPEERKFLSTYRIPGGGLLVMFRAENFRYELLQNENLTSKVCRRLGRWTRRLGEPNEYRTWID